MENRTEIGFSALWNILKRCWIVMLAVLIVATALAGVLSIKLHKSEYTASVKIWLFRNRTDELKEDAYSNLAIDYYNTEVSGRLLSDCMNIMVSNVVMDRAVKSYQAEYADGEGLTRQLLSKMVEVNTVEDTERLLELSVTADSPEKAQALADCWSKQFQDYMNTELMNGQSYVQIVDPALLPQQESNPVSWIKIGLIGVLAAMLVYAVAMMRYLLNDKIGSAEDVEKYLELNVLGAIPSRQNLSSTRKAYEAKDGE